MLLIQHAVKVDLHHFPARAVKGGAHGSVRLVDSLAVLGIRLVAHIDLHLDNVLSVLGNVHRDGQGAAGQSRADPELDGRPLRHGLAAGRTLPDNGAAGLVAVHYFHIRGVAGQLVAFQLGQHAVNAHSHKGQDRYRFDVRALAENQFYGIALFQDLALSRLRLDDVPLRDLLGELLQFLRGLHGQLQIVFLVQLFQ